MARQHLHHSTSATCAHTQAHVGPYFSSLFEFVQHYNDSPYDREPNHILGEMFDPHSGTAEVVEARRNDAIGRISTHLQLHDTYVDLLCTLHCTVSSSLWGWYTRLACWLLLWYGMVAVCGRWLATEASTSGFG